MLLWIVTSTPTYTKMAIMPRINCGNFMAPQPALSLVALLYEKNRMASTPKSVTETNARLLISVKTPSKITTANKPVMTSRALVALVVFSNFSSEVTLGILETAKMMATKANTPAKIKYSTLMDLMSALTPAPSCTLPNSKKLTASGPMVVPNEFTPPAMFSRCEPESAPPKAMANGWAEVCCNENPEATTKNAPKISPNEPLLTAGIMHNAPTMEMTSPRIMPFL